MFHCETLIVSGSQVDRYPDSAGVRRVDLGAQQVEAEVRMHCTDPGGVVAPAVVAAGEAGDGVHMRLPERLRPFVGAESGADPRNRFRSMEIKVNLAERKMG